MPPPTLLRPRRARNHFVLVTLLVGFLAGTRLICAQASAPAAALQPVGEGWPTYGGNSGGLRFSNSSQITRGTVGKLHPIWIFHTHATDTKEQREQLPSFEATPVLSGDTLYFTSPFDVVFALDARTGIERWHYDPILKPLTPKGIVTSRGVALSNGRVFVGTLDHLKLGARRLFS
jgi:quinoprotein glucose dehydrogenase